MNPADRPTPGVDTPAPLLLRGEVTHTRLRPTLHGFRYPTWMLMLPLRAWARRPGGALARNRAALVSFRDADHGEGGGDALAWVDALLRREGIPASDLDGGEIWLQTYPRVLGYAFKPVSFWYAHAADGRLVAVLAEVNNTFGERHAYLLSGDTLGWGREVTARKVFHVSPFCAVEGGYRFRFLRSEATGSRPARLIARVDHDDAQGPLIETRISGELLPLTARHLWRAWLAMPLLTMGVMARIHWQALRLWLKQVPFFRKPEPPSVPVSR
ncbi:DUF1365 domain-containing protein [Leptothrix sp. BB-4]